MSVGSIACYSFNRGVVSPLALARIDQKRIALAAEVMTNWIPRVLGPMSLRPGLQYIGTVASSALAHCIQHVFATDDVALCEFTNVTLRIWQNDALLTRATVTTAVNNGTFAGNITGWTDSSDVGGAIAYDAPYMKLTGNGTARARATQQVSVATAYQAVEHALHVTIQRGPVSFKVGTALGDDSLVNQTTLDQGVHSLAFTPNAASFYIEFSSTAVYKVQVAGCVIEAAGVLTLTSPYLAADLSKLRADQSGDVIFIACAGYQQMKIERRGTRPNARSWSLAYFMTDDGPFAVQNFTPTTITPSATTGDITLTASAPLFRATHIPSLWAITEQVQGVSAAIGADNTFTSSIKITGVGAARSITITITGSWTAVVRLQSSTDDTNWSDVPGEVWNTNVSGPYLDGLDDETIYYRLGIKTGDYTTGTAQCALTYSSGSLRGVVRLTNWYSSTSVGAQVLSDLGSIAATKVWAEGTWSTHAGWPTAVKLHEGRLWWFGQNGILASVSDDYYSHDANVIGDSGPINRTIGSGPVDTINWALGMQRLVLGAQGSEQSIRSSALDVPLTPTNFGVRACSTQGSGAVEAVRIDQNGIYVDRTNLRLYQLTFDLKNYLQPDYSSTDITALCPEFALPGIIRLAVQRKPDTRIHALRSDGTVMLGVIDAVEEVLCWLDIETDGYVEDAVVLPAASGSTEDQVYYVVRRTINGATVRYLEKWAKDIECRGTYSTNALLNKQADSFLTGTQGLSTTIAVPHLEGKDVVVWADGVDLSPDVAGVQTTYRVTSGNITVGTPVASYVVGLPYTAQWQSVKLSLQPGPNSTPLGAHKRINHISFIANWFHAKGVKFGPDFTDMDEMPGIEEGAVVDYNVTRTNYDGHEIPFKATWTQDLRLCLQAQAPRPATILCAPIGVEMNA